MRKSSEGKAVMRRSSDETKEWGKAVMRKRSGRKAVVRRSSDEKKQ